MQDTYIIQIEEPILEIGGDGAIAREVLTTVRDVFFVTQPPTVYEILDISTDALILEVNHQGPPGAPGLSSADAAILRYIADVDMGGQRISETGATGGCSTPAGAVSSAWMRARYSAGRMALLAHWLMANVRLAR